MSRTRNGLVTLVIGENDYQLIEDCLDKARANFDRATASGASRYAILTHLLENIGNQHASQQK